MLLFSLVPVGRYRREAERQVVVESPLGHPARAAPRAACPARSGRTRQPTAGFRPGRRRPPDLGPVVAGFVNVDAVPNALDFVVAFRTLESYRVLNRERGMTHSIAEHSAFEREPFTVGATAADIAVGAAP
jgi:hypothetical protein